MPVTHDELLATAAMLRQLLAAIDAEELSCSTGYRTRLHGAVVALESLAREA
jgi:hypothetical protein